ncbi:BCCT family transporter [Trueperella abortisuis]|uniref:BCCT family transporter n=1 Tax=Trueperella abortisuis TaxID=445930 RepID=UPI002893385F|nr:BCCT family transporter [Trueperella abortisuis]
MKATTRRPVVLASLVIIALVAGAALVTPTGTASLLTRVVEAVSDWFGWFFVLLAATVLVFVVVIGFKYSHVRLGGDDAKPEYSTFSWACMLFAAGIGTDILFFAVSEPVQQYMRPPQLEPQSLAAAEQAPVWTMFHYGLHGWGMYCLMGIAMGYFAYRKKLPLAVRSTLSPLLGKRTEGWAGHSVDVATIVATIFGLATSLGIGVVMLATALEILVGLEANRWVHLGLVILAITAATLSAVSGINRGIKILSQLNVCLSLFLCLWVLITGNTTYLLRSIVMNIGDFVVLFPSMFMDTMAIDYPEAWMTLWTLFFWAWWIAWASFVGLFLARISHGRTIGQFVLGTLTIPLLYVGAWATIFGGRAIEMIRGGDLDFAELTLASPERGIFALLETHPIPTVIISIACLTGLLFYITSADSGALVMANLSSKLPDPSVDARLPMRALWAVATGVLTIAMLIVDGIPALQNATIIMGLPFGFVMVGVMISLARSLKDEGEHPAAEETHTEPHSA